MKLKNILIFVVGILLSYAFYFFIAKNGNIVTKILFGALAGFAYWNLISMLLSKLKEKDYYDSILKLGLVACMVLSIVTYEQFDKYTYGSHEEQRHLLETESEMAIATVSNIIHTPAMRIKRKNIPEMWELEYQFQDKKGKTYKGYYKTDVKPPMVTNDTLSIHYVSKKPQINKADIKR